jgi:uncharacterized protein DUF4232
MRYVAGLCALVALIAVGWGYSRTSSNASTRTVTVRRTVVHTITRAVTTTTPAAAGNACSASDLTGTFAVVEGSAGGGNIVYTLRATNAGQGPCTVSGTPTVFFLDASGHVLPSKLSSNGGTAAVVTLQPGDTATSQVRFSPDVTPCDPGTATTIRTELPDQTTFDAKIDPATKLCGAGSLQPSQWAGAS